MGESVQNTELRDALESIETLRLRGFTASCGPTGSVVVDRWNHVRGVWHYHAGNYFWTDAGYSVPSFRANSMIAAVEYTLNVISSP